MATTRAAPVRRAQRIARSQRDARSDGSQRIRRAARELQATGEHLATSDIDRREELTAHETLIARHVASGSTSKEVAGELFLSPRTIDAHLPSIFRKLDITSRRQLRGMDL